jgi:NADPH:quinone reductase-like Zn-dependent oxidoreductase
MQVWRRRIEPIGSRCTLREDKSLQTVKYTDGEGFDVLYDTVGGRTLDDSFASVRRYSGHVLSCLGWGSHSLAPQSFRGATHSGVFTLLPLITEQGRAHHGEILAAVAKLADEGKLKPLLSREHFDASTISQAHALVASGSLGRWSSSPKRDSDPCCSVPSSRVASPCIGEKEHEDHAAHPGTLL